MKNKKITNYWLLTFVAGFFLTALAGADLATAQTSAYLINAEGEPIRSGSGNCIRLGYWSPALATMSCDPDLASRPKAMAAAPAAPPVPKPSAKPTAKPEQEYSPPKPTLINVTPVIDSKLEYWAPLIAKQAQPPQSGLYTYLLFGYDPQSKKVKALVRDRYAATLNAVTNPDTDIKQLKKNELPINKQKNSHLFLVPCKSKSDCQKIESYNSELSRTILHAVSNSLSKDSKRKTLANTLQSSPGPFFISSIRPLIEYTTGDRPNLIFIDFSSLPLLCIQTTVRLYRQQFQQKSIDINEVNDLSKLEYGCKLQNGFRAIAESIPMTIETAKNYEELFKSAVKRISDPKLISGAKN